MKRVKSKKEKINISRKPKTQDTKNPHNILDFYWLILILLIGILSYSNTFHGPFIFDDIPHIVTREGIHLDSFSINKLSNLEKTIQKKGRPVSLISFALNYYFGKLDTFGYHLVNFFIHFFTAICVYLFIKLTLELPGFHGHYGEWSKEIALSSSLLFVAHPVQTQAVTYVVQRMTSLCTLFFLSSMFFYVKGRLKEGTGGLSFYALSGISAVLAFGSKQNAATLPLFIGLYEITFFQNLDWDRIKKKLAFFVSALFLPLIMTLVYTKFQLFSHLMKEYEKRPFTMGQRMLTQLRVIAHYISLLLYPHPSRLNLDYDFPISTSIINPPSTLLGLLIILGLLGVAFYLIKRRSVISFCILWFFGNLVIESSIYPLDLVYEHRLYLPSVGFFLLVSILLVKGIEKLKASVRTKQGIKIGILTSLIIPLSIMSYQRNEVWQDRAALWQDAANKSPRKSRTRYNLANVYAQRQDYDTAIPHYLKTIQLQPDYAKPYNNLGFCYFFKGDIQQAIAETKTALKYDDRLVDAYFNMGTYYWNLGKPAQAREEFQKALRINPNYQKAIFSLKELDPNN